MIENTETETHQAIAEDLSVNKASGTSGIVAGRKAPGRSRPVSLGQMVAEAGILTPEEVAAAQETAWKERLPLGLGQVLCGGQEPGVL